MGKKLSKQSVLDTRINKEPIVLNQEQERARELILNNDITLITGRAASGKSLTACKVGLELLFNKNSTINKIVITRPYVTTEDYGFLPGSIEEKFQPNIYPLKEILYQLRDKAQIDTLFDNNSIEILPLGFARGVTLVNCFVIADEIENMTHTQSEMLLTRLGVGSKMVLCGDQNQADIKRDKSCISFLLTLTDINGFAGIELISNHRHKIVEHIIDRYKLRS